MKLYLEIIAIFLIIVISGNIFYVQTINTPIGTMLLWLLIAIAICGISSAIITIMTRIVPDKWFSPFRRRYKVFPKEKNIYIKLNIKKWKDRIPELGKLSGFAKNKCSEPNNPQYLFKFLTETCIAETLHLLSAIFGILVLIILPKQFFFTISLPVFLLNAFLHTMPILVQRYIRPKLMKMYQRIEKLQSQNEIEEDLEYLKKA